MIDLKEKKSMICFNISEHNFAMLCRKSKGKARSIQRDTEEAKPREGEGDRGGQTTDQEGKG